MKKQTGFTLIELVIVIIILGILAAVAVPKFVDLQSDARASSLKGVKAALEDAATLAYSRAAIDGVEKGADEKISMAGATVNVSKGYPLPTIEGIEAAVDFGANDFKWQHGSTPSYVTISGAITTTTNCRVSYELGENDGDRPIIEASVTGC